MYGARRRHGCGGAAMRLSRFRPNTPVTNQPINKALEATAIAPTLGGDTPMASKHTFSLSLWLTAIAVLGLLFSACAPAAGVPIASSSGLSVWLDQAPDGSILPLAPFTLKAHARDASGGGVIEIDFKVNDIFLGAVNTDASAALAYAELPWNPSAPGPYTIEAWG